MDALPDPTPSFPKNREIEYTQICETYRQGVRTLFEMFKFYIIFQGGLGTLAGAIFSRSDIQSNIHLCNITVNLPLFLISVIGVGAAIVAPRIARRLYRYHDTIVARGVAIEKEFDMQQICLLGDIWKEGESGGAATRAAFVLFGLIALLWLIGLFDSIHFVTAS
jgi:hypothetical protein